MRMQVCAGKLACHHHVKRFLQYVRRRLLRWGLLLSAALVAGYYGLPWLVPFPAALTQPPAMGRDITDRQGVSLRRLLADGHRSMGSVPLEEIPQALRDATLAAEDKRFYQHGGIDFLSLGRAVRDALKRGRTHSGASTISQQLVKIAVPRSRTLTTKVLEMLTARRLEMTWSKDRILEEYLNRLDYGNLRLGCAAAAQGYFSKPLRDCSTAECALLAGLPQAPSRLNPYRHLESAQRRQAYVLERMEINGALAAADRQRAAQEPLKLARDYGDFLAPHFVEMVLAGDSAPEDLRTTLDLPLQQFCERMVKDRLARLQEQNVQQAACVVIDNATGGIRALVGSRDFQQQQVNGATARRSPGSALKPFTYLLALQQGDAPATMVADLPVEFSTPTGLFTPKNYSGRTYGPVSYRIALANSLNLAAVRVLEKIGGAETLISSLQAVGITTLTRPVGDYGLGLTIGGGEVTLLELANAYATLARRGLHQPVVLMESRVNAANTEQVFDPISCYLLADILADNDARARSFGTRSSLRMAFPAAVKTGTSTDYRDNWCLGFTPQYTVAVWAGNFDGSPMRGVSGVSGAAPLFRDIFVYLDSRERQSWYAQPAGVLAAAVDPLTGRAVPAEHQEHRKPVQEKFARQYPPPSPLDGQYDTQGRVLLPKSYATWLESGDNYLGQAVALAPAGSPLHEETARLRITVPLSGSTYLLDPDLPSQGQVLMLKANLPNVEWKSDTLTIEQRPGGPAALLRPGTHEISVMDSQTQETRTTRILVRKL